jgi:hypothetical protein
MPADGVLVGGLDLVGLVGKEPHIGEAELAQHLVACRVGAGQFLVRLAEVGLQRVDGLEPDRHPARCEVGWSPGPAG